MLNHSWKSLVLLSHVETYWNGLWTMFSPCLLLVLYSAQGCNPDPSGGGTQESHLAGLGLTSPGKGEGVAVDHWRWPGKTPAFWWKLCGNIHHIIHSQMWNTICVNINTCHWLGHRVENHIFAAAKIMAIPSGHQTWQWHNNHYNYTEDFPMKSFI